MKFVDRVKIYVRSGDGGDGCMSFYRDRSNPVGYADGGDGGNGGNIVFKVVKDLNTLIDFSYKQHIKAGRGGHGKGKNQYGAKGQDAVINVPQGTQIYDSDLETEDQGPLTDLTHIGQQAILVHGGSGGIGNARLKSVHDRRPRRRTLGTKGTERCFILYLKVIANVGLVGYPNVGKSTFLAACTRATPKIADYPFTTLVPNLGVVHLKAGKSFVLADVPGLHPKADQGKGLSNRLLGHLERTHILLHLIDVLHKRPSTAYHTVRKALKSYGHGLEHKIEVVVLNKCDLLSSKEVLHKKNALETYIGKKVETVSAFNAHSLTPLLQNLWNILEEKAVLGK